jgi:hypothetical protein
MPIAASTQLGLGVNADREHAFSMRWVAIDLMV